LAGTSDNHFGLLRLNTDGSLDTTFSSDGKLTYAVGRYDEGNSVAANADGDILMAGTSDGKFSVVKFNSSGEADEGFHLNFASISVADGNCNSVRYTPDGQHILLAGTSSENGITTGITLLQLNLDGSLDTNFGDEGVMTYGLENYSAANSIAFDAAGNILVAGTSNNDLSLVKLTKDGQVDEDFAFTGTFVAGISGQRLTGYSVTVDADGAIWMAGTATDRTNALKKYAVVKLDQYGELDAGFGKDGILVQQISNQTEGGFIALQQDGQILVAGTDAEDFGVMRLNPDGTLDKTFGQALKFDSATVFENTTDLVYTAKAGDLDGSLNALTYSLSGADKDLFTLDATTGEVRFRTAPDYENPSDNGSDNTYYVTLIASDGDHSSSLGLRVEVKNSAEATPIFASGGTATPAVIEGNSSAGQVVYAAHATDADSLSNLLYSLSGDDANNFNFNAATGEVKFSDQHAAADGSNTYNLDIKANDGVHDSTNAVPVVITVNDGVAVSEYVAAQSAINSYQHLVM
jgi:uncharacterized delta-60 repeat protein